MSLALRMGRTLAELRRSMSVHEFNLWVELYRVDPWGEWRDDLRAGIVASTVANVMTTGGKFKPSDFVPDFDPRAAEEPAEKTPEQLKDVLLKVTAMMGGTIG